MTVFTVYTATKSYALACWKALAKICMDTCSENMTAGMLSRRVQGENRPQRTAVSIDSIK